MKFEEENKKAEQVNSQENKPEKEVSLEEIDELLKGRNDIYDNLNKVTVGVLGEAGIDLKDLKGRREAVDKTSDKYDESAYVKAGFWQKFENFTRFGLRKKHYGLLKSKERGLLDKTEIDEDVLGKDMEITDKKEKEFAQKEIIDIRGDFGKENSERIITKRFEKVDNEIIKIVSSERTEAGVMEFAGKIRDGKVDQMEKVDGADLIRLKEDMEKHNESKKKLPEILKFVSSEDEKERITAKLSDEENQTKERIKEKEEKIKEELKIFSEPYGERLKETMEMQNDLLKISDFIKTSEAKLNKEIKEYSMAIEEAKKLNLLGGIGGDIVKNIEEKKAALDQQAKDFTERKIVISGRLEQLKNNKKEIEAVLGKINNIGKTKKEIEEEKKSNKTNKTEETAKKEKMPTDEKKERDWEENLAKAWGLNTGKKEKTKEDWAEDWSFVEGQKIADSKSGQEDTRKHEEKTEDEEGDLDLGKDSAEIKNIAKKIFFKLGLNNIIKDKRRIDDIVGIATSKIVNDIKRSGIEIVRRDFFIKQIEKFFKKTKEEYKSKYKFK